MIDLDDDYEYDEKPKKIMKFRKLPVDELNEGTKYTILLEYENYNCLAGLEYDDDCWHYTVIRLLEYSTDKVPDYIIEIFPEDAEITDDIYNWIDNDLELGWHPDYQLEKGYVKIFEGIYEDVDIFEKENKIINKKKKDNLLDLE